MTHNTRLQEMKRDGHIPPLEFQWWPCMTSFLLEPNPHSLSVIGAILTRSVFWSEGRDLQVPSARQSPQSVLKLRAHHEVIQQTVLLASRSWLRQQGIRDCPASGSRLQQGWVTTYLNPKVNQLQSQLSCDRISQRTWIFAREFRVICVCRNTLG